MKFVRAILKTAFFGILLFSVLAFLAVYFLEEKIADNYKVTSGETLNISSYIPITAEYEGAALSQNNLNHVGKSYDVDLKIFGLIPFSTVNVEVVDDMYVSVLGNPFGMKLYTDGVLVIEISEVNTNEGAKNPAKAAGIRVGDYIKSVGGVPVDTNEELLQIVTESAGMPLRFEIVRNGHIIDTLVTPQKCDDSVYRVGIWVRDSSAGIGTLTFYSPTADVICGLGHGVCDNDTDELLTIEQGELVEAEIISVKKGDTGNPGELKGKFNYSTIAQIEANRDNGVYAVPEKAINAANLTEVALKQEVTNGKAQILCTVEGDKPELYDCEIKIRSSSYRSKTQNLIVEVTDLELLHITGGIVQGMSGSPILQNGKLVGAVTHVLVDDPTKGYGIFAENMLETAQGVADNSKLKEAS